MIGGEDKISASSSSDKSTFMSRNSNDNTASSSNNRPVDSEKDENNDEKQSNTNNDFSGFQLLPTSANRSTFRCPEKFGYFPDSKDCTKYFVCVFGEPLHESCTGKLSKCTLSDFILKNSYTFNNI